jgi:mRNA-degrading endonuclease HigB of HigAB toxin-antitoxin module
MESPLQNQDVRMSRTRYFRRGTQQGNCNDSTGIISAQIGDKASRKTPQNIKDQYASASLVGRNRVVFNIKGNDFQLIVAVAYQIGVVYVKFIGTHVQYDKVDAATVEME